MVSEGGKVGWVEGAPFLSSIVTVSFAHFIKNLPPCQLCREYRALKYRAQLAVLYRQGKEGVNLPHKLHLDRLSFASFSPAAAMVVA